MAQGMGVLEEEAEDFTYPFSDSDEGILAVYSSSDL